MFYIYVKKLVLNKLLKSIVNFSVHKCCFFSQYIPHIQIVRAVPETSLALWIWMVDFLLFLTPLIASGKYRGVYSSKWFQLYLLSIEVGQGACPWSWSIYCQIINFKHLSLRNVGFYLNGVRGLHHLEECVHCNILLFKCVMIIWLLCIIYILYKCFIYHWGL